MQKRDGIALLVLKRLKEKERPKRGKKTLVLSISTYESFEHLCRQEGKYPSDVVDEFIAVFVDELEQRKRKSR